MKSVNVVIGLLFIGSLYIHTVAPTKKRPRKKNDVVVYKTNSKRLKVVFGG